VFLTCLIFRQPFLVAIWTRRDSGRRPARDTFIFPGSRGQGEVGQPGQRDSSGPCATVERIRCTAPTLVSTGQFENERDHPKTNARRTTADAPETLDALTADSTASVRLWEGKAGESGDGLSAIEMRGAQISLRTGMKRYLPVWSIADLYASGVRRNISTVRVSVQDVQ
jgi:hypothetical protein